MNNRRAVLGGRGRRTWAAATALSLALVTACTSGSGEGDDPAAGTGGSTGTETSTTAGDVGSELPTADPVDVAAGLADFEAPPESSGVAAADPAHCPGANPEHVLSVFPEATPFQSASATPQHQGAGEDELALQCRLSYEVELLDDECTLMEVRDVTFTTAAEGSLGSHNGALSTTSTRTYFTGMAQQTGVVLDYTLEAGCDATSDLSDLESEFRAIWLQTRDQFVATPVYERPS